jgi:hypothetical protein
MSDTIVEIPVPTVEHDQQIQDILDARETGTLRQRGMTMADVGCNGNCPNCSYEAICDF